MSGRPRKIPSVSELLATWPPEGFSADGLPGGRERSLDWDDAAATIQARIEAGSKADETGEISTYLTDEEIFSPPAGQTDKDGHNTGSSTEEPGRVSASAPVPTKSLKSVSVPEESKMSLTHEQRERDRKSLQDLARLAQMTPAPSSVRMPSAPVASSSKPSNGDDAMIPSSRKEEDSGLVNFAAFSPQPPPSASAPISQPPSSMRGMDQVMGAAAPLSASSTPAASTGLFDDEPLSGHPPSVGPHGMGAYAPISGHPSAPPFVATLPSGGVPHVTADSARPPVSIAVPQSVHPSVHPAAAQPKKKSGAIIYMFGTVVALAAVAAGGFFVVRPMVLKSRQATVARVETKVETPAPVVPETRWQDQIAAAKPADPAPAAQDDTASDKVEELDTKAPAKVAAVTGPAMKKPAAPAKDNKAAAAFVLNDEPKAAPAPPPPAPPVAVANAGGAPSGGDLDKAIKTAAGPSDSTNVTPADDKKPAFAAGTVPQRPSQGAVTGAIGAVLSNARACLGADDAVSRATIKFGSDGSVQSVSVHGGAAGKPAEQCIKGALSAAKVPPFAESTYTANITVRH